MEFLGSWCKVMVLLTPSRIELWLCWVLTTVLTLPICFPWPHDHVENDSLNKHLTHNTITADNIGVEGVTCSKDSMTGSIV